MKLWHLPAYALVFSMLCLLAPHARAQYVDISKGRVIKVATCWLEKSPYSCVLIRQRSELYVLARDEEGLLYECAVEHNGTLTIIWKRTWAPA